MIDALLNEMYQLNIELKQTGNKTKLVYKQSVINEQLKTAIKRNKNAIIQRIQENEIARLKGYLVYNNGELYEFRYGAFAFLYIERIEGNKARAYRVNYSPDKNTPIRTKILLEAGTFQQAWEKANGFITWLQSQKRGEQKWMKKR